VELPQSSEHARILIERIVQEPACRVLVLIHAPDPASVEEASKRGSFADITDAEPIDWQSSIDIVLRRFTEYHDPEGAFRRRAVTERAKGILMERHSIDQAAAFEVRRDDARPGQPQAGRTSWSTSQPPWWTVTRPLPRRGQAGRGRFSWSGEGSTSTAALQPPRPTGPAVDPVCLKSALPRHVGRASAYYHASAGLGWPQGQLKTDDTPPCALARTTLGGPAQPLHGSGGHLLIPPLIVSRELAVVRSGQPLWSKDQTVAREVTLSPYARPDREGTRAVMTDPTDTRERAVERLRAARERRTLQSRRYEAARGSPAELLAFVELRTAEDQFAAREAWLAWIDRDY
jgi:hypothetical protein